MDEITADSLMIVGPRRRGRPRTTAEKTTVAGWVTLEERDKLEQIAARHDMTVSKTVGKILGIYLKNK